MNSLPLINRLVSLNVTYHSFPLKKIVLLKGKYLIGACLLLTCCLAHRPEYAETITQKKMMEYLSSLHIVASKNNADSVFGIGYYNVYMGKNELGNKIMNYALCLKDSITYYIEANHIAGKTE